MPFKFMVHCALDALVEFVIVRAYEAFPHDFSIYSFQQIEKGKKKTPDVQRLCVHQLIYIV